MSRLFNLRFWTFGGWFAMGWIAAGSAVLGVVGNLVGSSQQASAISDAADKNAAAQRDQNNAAWANYLMTRGIAPTGQVTAGVLPAAGSYNAVNSRLPLWANVTSSNGPQRWVRKGTPAPVQRWSLDSMPTAPVASGLPGSPGASPVMGAGLGAVLNNRGNSSPFGPPASFVPPPSYGYG